MYVAAASLTSCSPLPCEAASRGRAGPPLPRVVAFCENDGGPFFFCFFFCGGGVLLGLFIAAAWRRSAIATRPARPRCRAWIYVAAASSDSCSWSTGAWGVFGDCGSRLRLADFAGGGGPFLFAGGGVFAGRLLGFLADAGKGGGPVGSRSGGGPEDTGTGGGPCFVSGGGRSLASGGGVARARPRVLFRALISYAAGVRGQIPQFSEAGRRLRRS